MSTSTHRRAPSTRRARAGHAVLSARLWRQVLLTTGAALGVLCVLAAVASVAFGVKPLVFRSGSMSPGIPTGALALAQHEKASTAKVGDVVSVVDDGRRVTHRVVATEPAKEGTRLTLQGDANAAPDPQPYVVSSVDHVVWSAPRLGYVVSFLGSPIGLTAGGALVVGCLVVGSRGSSERGRRRGSPGTRRAVAAVAVVALAGAGAVAAPKASSTLAAFSDAATTTSGSIGAGTVPAPTLSCGLIGAFSVTFSWTAVTGATSYTLHYGASGASTVTVTGTSTTVTTVISSGTAWVTANHNYGSTTWTSVNSNSRSYAVLAISLCS